MKQKDILFLLGTGLIFVFAWIGFGVYHNIITSTIPESVSVQLQPLAPNFDTKTIDALKKRVQIAPQLLFTPNSADITPTPTLIPTPAQSIPIATQSAPIATVGGIIQ